MWGAKSPNLVQLILPTSYLEGRLPCVASPRCCVSETKEAAPSGACQRQGEAEPSTDCAEGCYGTGWKGSQPGSI